MCLLCTGVRCHGHLEEMGSLHSHLFLQKHGAVGNSSREETALVIV